MKADKETYTAIQDILANKPFAARLRLEELFNKLEVIEEEKQKNKTRTLTQNAAFHKWLEMVAEELDRHGHTIQNVVEKIQKAEIRPTGANLKEIMFKPYLMAATGKDSTTKMSKHEVDVVFEGLNKFLGENFEIHIPFPSREHQSDLIAGMDMAKNNTYYNDNYEEPTI